MRHVRPAPKSRSLRYFLFRAAAGNRWSETEASLHLPFPHFPFIFLSPIFLSKMSYPGGKNGAGTYQRIISQIPPHRLYIEPFVGGGSILLRKRPAEESIVCDLEAAAIAAVQEAWRRKHSLTSPLAAVAAANGTNGGADRHAMNGVRVPHRLNGRADQVAASGTASGTAKLRAEVRDGLKLLATRFEPDAFIYADPPYLQSAVLSRLRYRHVLSVEGHRKLLRLLKAQACPVMISGYWSRLYAEELSHAAGWRTIKFGSMTRGGYQCEEWLWMNFPVPTELHDYRYVGENYREREKFRRQQRRWSTRLQKMSVVQRQALMSVLTGSISTERQGTQR